MSHIHIPDGILTLWLWILGYVLTGIFFIIFGIHLKKTSNHKKLAVMSVISALMFLTMSVPIPLLLPYHINLSALTGILLGPLYAGGAIFTVNLILALLGHGGITIVGLNTIILIAEAFIANYLYAFFRTKMSTFTPFKSAFFATFLALMASTAITVAIVYLGTQNLELLVHSHEHGAHHEHIEAAFDIHRFFILILAAGAIGWTLESYITAVIVGYIAKVKPELLENK